MSKKQKQSDDKQDNSAHHSHPVPASELPRYRVNRDFHLEQDIASYVESQAPDEIIQNVEKVKQEVVLGDIYEMWDVITDKNRWWVITNLTNLYSQKHFPSLDYTLSFHIGLMMRLRSRPDSATVEEQTPFDEVFRRQEQAKHSLDNAVKPEDSNFIEWSDILINQLCPGKSNQELRHYLKNTTSPTWQLVNWLTHYRNANEATATIAVYACDTVVGHFIQILEREKIDQTKQCPVCKSRRIRTHFDI